MDPDDLILTEIKERVRGTIKFIREDAGKRFRDRHQGELYLSVLELAAKLAMAIGDRQLAEEITSDSRFYRGIRDEVREARMRVIVPSAGQV